MKITVMLLLFIDLTISQVADGRQINRNRITNLIDVKNQTYLLSEDLNNDGMAEVLKGESIIKTDKYEYWVKNTELVSSKGDIISFNTILQKNSLPVIDQVNADHGYILVFTPNSNEVEVYIAGVFGNKNSDSIILLLNE